MPEASPAPTPAEIAAVTGGGETLCAMMTATCMSIAGREGVSD